MFREDSIPKVIRQQLEVLVVTVCKDTVITGLQALYPNLKEFYVEGGVVGPLPNVIKHDAAI